MNKGYFIYLQHVLESKFMNVNSFVTPLKIATCAVQKIEIQIPDHDRHDQVHRNLLQL